MLGVEPTDWRRWQDGLVTPGDEPGRTVTFDLVSARTGADSNRSSRTPTIDDQGHQSALRSSTRKVRAPSPLSGPMVVSLIEDGPGAPEEEEEEVGLALRSGVAFNRGDSPGVGRNNAINIHDKSPSPGAADRNSEPRVVESNSGAGFAGGTLPAMWGQATSSESQPGHLMQARPSSSASALRGGERGHESAGIEALLQPSTPLRTPPTRSSGQRDGLGATSPSQISSDVGAADDSCVDSELDTAAGDGAHGDAGEDDNTSSDTLNHTRVDCALAKPDVSGGAGPQTAFTSSTEHTNKS